MRPPIASEEQEDRQDDSDGDAHRTPKKITPPVATSESASATLAHPVVADQDAEVHERECGDDHHGGQCRLRQVGKQTAEEEQKNRDESGADQAGDLALGARLLGHGGARAARRYGEALEEAGGDVRGADADHLLVGHDLVAAAGGEARGRGDGIGQRDQRDADGGDE